MNYVEVLTDQLRAMAAGAVQLLPSLVIATIVIIVTALLARLAVRIADRLTAKSTMRESLRGLVETVVRILIWIVGIFVAAVILLPGLTPASLLAGLGVGTLAIGFAFQDIFENFLAGVLLMIREKMRIGDMIECEGIMGKVEHISLRETHVRHPSGELFVVPNSLLFKNPVKIMTDQPQRRYETVVGVSYDTDIEEALRVVRKAAESTDVIDPERGIEVYVREFGASSVDMTVRWWSPARPVEMHKSRDAILRAIKRDLDAAGMEIPFPYVTQTFKEPLRIVSERDAEQPDGE